MKLLYFCIRAPTGYNVFALYSSPRDDQTLQHQIWHKFALTYVWKKIVQLCFMLF